MPEAEFWNSSLRAIFLRINGARKLELEKWRRVRWQTSVLLNIQLEKKDRRTPEKLLHLPGDVEETTLPTAAQLLGPLFAASAKLK